MNKLGFCRSLFGSGSAALLLADLIPQQWSEFDVKYFESGDCYTFGK